ncbi:MAG: hypothetical protein A4E20_03710 [Nitrospira sp. SG-bin2]|nr:MAG: hypothetical protein A4E20_03710 [Nitrospira sp. SG-bin2]
MVSSVDKDVQTSYPPALCTNRLFNTSGVPGKSATRFFPFSRRDLLALLSARSSSRLLIS